MNTFRIFINVAKIFLCYIVLFAGNEILLAQYDTSITNTGVSDTVDTLSTSVKNDSNAVDTLKKLPLRENIKKIVISKISTGANIESTDNSVTKIQDHINGYTAYQGRIIRNIGIKQLEIFGQTCSDTSQVPTKWLERLGNGLHIRTQPYILKNQMLIRPGDRFDAYALMENERLLRELPYIDDALTYVTEVGSDSVDVIVVTKDVLPLGFGLELFDVAYGRSNLYNKNLLGLGHELNYTLTWNYNRNPFYGHKLLYRIQNIGNSFFSLDVSYENQWNIEARKVNIERDFFSQNTKFAGGIRFEKINSLKNIILPDTTLEDVKVDYNYHDFWLGRAISLRREITSSVKTNIALTARVIRYEFFQKPEVGERFLYEFHERTTCLMSLGISRQGFYKSNLVYGFGRTEDIPYGSALSVTGGIDFDEFYNRPYLGVSYSHGSHLRNIGYLRKEVAFGGFIHQQLEQGLLLFKINYFTDLLNHPGRYKYRIFTDIDYRVGIHRFEDEYLEFNKRDGIRGLTSTDLRGNQRLNLNLESICYSPHVLLGFRFVYYVFIDAGIISNESSILINNEMYTGFGAGVRIRNDNLIFDAIHFRLAYYPNLPVEASPEYILLTSASNRKFDNFTIPKPDILKYQTRL